MKKYMLIGLVLVLGMLLAACGGGDAETESVSLTFEGNDSFQFIPDTASMPAGAEVEVTLENAGNLEHSWTLVASDVDATAATDADVVVTGASTGSVAPGESATITFTAPEAGTYQMVCTVPGHAAGGMVGTVTVN
ncbi:MAG: plastocyanin/azurin family copper-binding protein [Candidatus Promineifilaceae bacterium]|nr:plastocyanin/azurin family copper-binding protein [Candidatus Promineifilaceae bacterium]